MHVCENTFKSFFFAATAKLFYLPGVNFFVQRTFHLFALLCAKVWLDMFWLGNDAVFIAFLVDTTAMHPSITLQLLSASVKSGEENQHTVPTLPIHSPPLISALLGSLAFFSFFFPVASFSSSFSNIWKGSMSLHDGTAGLKVSGQTLEECTTNCSQRIPDHCPPLGLNLNLNGGS